MTSYLVGEHVRKTFGRFTAVQDASLDVQPGEILALLGPNGAGKTTFIKILTTLLVKDSGKVTIMGYDLDRQPEEIRHVIGYVGQDTERSAYARLTAVENLHFFGRLRGMSRQQIDQQIEKLSTSFDFHEAMNKPFVTLSGGQKQTVVIMRAFLHDPPLIYLDEPTKGLDPIIARKIRHFLKQVVAEEQKSLLLTSHVLSEVDEMAHRVALIHHGSIPTIDTPARLKNNVGATEFVELEKAALPEAVQQKILTLSPVLFCIEREPQWVSFGVSDVMEGAEAIIRVLREEHLQVGFRHHTVSLEDAFLHHVGELTEKFDL
jgi:ABC-2 type transport system ATP-binding protein